MIATQPRLNLTISAAERHGRPAPSNRAQALSTQRFFDAVLLSRAEAKAVEVKNVVQIVLDARFGYDTSKGRMYPRAMKPKGTCIDGVPFMVIVPVSIHHLYRTVTIERIMDPTGNTTAAISQALRVAGIEHFQVRQLSSLDPTNPQRGIYFVIILQAVRELAAPTEDAVVELPKLIEFNPIKDYPQGKLLHWCLGSRDGKTLEWKPLGSILNQFVSGTTQIAGKSSYWTMNLAGLVFNHTPEIVRIAVIDPKHVNSGWLEGSPYLFCEMVRDDDIAGARRVVATVFDEVQRRKRLFGAVGATSLDEYNRIAKAKGVKPLPAIVFVFDEFVSITQDTHGKRDPLYVYLRKVVSQCAAFGIYTVLTTQKIDAEVVEGVISTQCPTRVALAATTDEQFKAALGLARYNHLRTRLTAPGRAAVRVTDLAAPFVAHMPFIPNSRLLELARGAWGAGSGADEPVEPPVAFEDYPLTTEARRLVKWAVTHPDAFKGGMSRTKLIEAFERKGGSRTGDGGTSISADSIETILDHLVMRGLLVGRGQGTLRRMTPKLTAMVAEVEINHEQG